MLQKLIIIVIALAVFAAIAYQMGWLSSEGESVFQKTTSAIGATIRVRTRLARLFHEQFSAELKIG